MFKNGNNTNFVGFWSTGNPSLSCIKVDSAAYSTANWTNIDSFSSFSDTCGAPCIVNIPDANFKSFLVAHTGINTNSDSEIQCTEALAFNGMIDCSNLSILDLTGIEAFTTLTQLRCSNNSLTTLNLIQNAGLTFLDASTNGLTNLDITQNTALTSVSISNNNIISFNISNNTLLESISIEGNLLTSMDLSNHSFLTYLNAKSNDLTSLNVKNGNNTNFVYFWSTGNLNLICIEADDTTWSAANWTNIDITSSFSSSCGGTVGIDDHNKSLKFSTYPNPNYGVINISSERIIDEIIIYDLQGRKIKTVIPNKKTIQIDATNVKKGMYLIHLKSEKSIVRQQLIIN